MRWIRIWPAEAFTSAVLLVICAHVVVAKQSAPGATKPPQSLAMGASKSRMTFFVTSRGLGKSADLADLAKADAHCQALATAEGAGDHMWRAYVSAPAANGKPAVNAIDRIGAGPWYNAEAELVAANREEVRTGAKRLSKDTALTERGDPVGNLAVLKQTGRFYCFAID
jgi:hypothetical protein